MIHRTNTDPDPPLKSKVVVLATVFESDTGCAVDAELPRLTTAVKPGVSVVTVIVFTVPDPCASRTRPTPLFRLPKS